MRLAPQRPGGYARNATSNHRRALALLAAIAVASWIRMAGSCVASLRFAGGWPR
jgi:hypothetical protein